MADPKKPDPTGEPIPPEQMTYPTPELNPETGAPIDTRFQHDNTQEATAQQPSPKSGAAPKAKAEDDDEDEAKGKDKPRSRR
jgi:hypothetical protein